MTPCFLTVFRKLVKVNGGQVESVHWQGQTRSQK